MLPARPANGTGDSRTGVQKSRPFLKPIKDPREGMTFWQKFKYFFTETGRQSAQRENAERDKRLLEGGENAIDSWHDRERYYELTLSKEEFLAWKRRLWDIGFLGRTEHFGHATGIRAL